MGLNKSYSNVCGSILMMNPLPGRNKVYGLILQHDRQMEVATHQEHSSISHAMHTARSPAAPSSSPHRKPLHCTYCDQDDHLVDRYFYIIGFSVGHKWHGKNVKPRNKKAAAHNVELKKDPINESPTR